MTENSWTSSSVSSLSILGWIPSSPINLCLSKGHNITLYTNHSLPHYESFILLISVFQLRGWMPWGQLVLLLKTEAKQALTTSAFSPSSVTVLLSESKKGWGLLNNKLIIVIFYEVLEREHVKMVRFIMPVTQISKLWERMCFLLSKFTQQVTDDT